MFNAPTLLRLPLVLFGLFGSAVDAFAAEEEADQAIQTYYFSLPIGEVMRLISRDREHDCNPKNRARLAKYLIPAKNVPTTDEQPDYSNSLLARRFGPVDINGTRKGSATPDFYCVTFPANRVAAKNGTSCAMATPAVEHGAIRFCGGADAKASESGKPPVTGFRGAHGAYGFDTCDALDRKTCQSNHKKEDLDYVNKVIDINLVFPR